MQFHARALLFVSCILMLASGFSASAQEPKGAWLGIEVRNLTQAEAEQRGWDAPRGAMVANPPARNSPAEKAGLKAGDVIVAVERTLIDTAEEFNAALAGKEAGTELRLQVVSGGRERRVIATLAVQPGISLAKADRPELMLDTGGHMGVIKGIIFTPDGKQLLSAGEDKVIRVWDWETGTIVRRIRGQVGPGDEGKVIAMVLSSDGRVLAAAGFMAPGDSGSAVGNIRIFDFATGRLMALLPGHRDIVTSLAFSPDGKRLISGSSDKTAIIWDIATSTQLRTLQGHTDWVYGVAFTPDGERVVTASDDTTLRLWRVKDGSLITEMRGHKREIFRALAVRSSDGMIASGDATGEIRLWDGMTGRFLRTLGYQEAVVGILAFSPDGSRLLSTCAGGVPCATQPQIIWDVASGARLQQPKFHDNIVIAGTISPNGRFVTTGGGNDMKIHVWDLASGASRRLLVGKGTSKVAAGFSTDGQFIAWGSTPGYLAHSDRGLLELQLRLPNAGTPLGRPELLPQAAVGKFVRARTTFGPYSLVHRQGGRFADLEGILDVKKDGQTVASITLQQSTGSRHLSYTFGVDGQTIFSGGGNGVLMAYDLTGKQLGEFVGHESDVWAVAPSADGRLLLSGSSDQTVRLWNIKTRELIATLFQGADGEWVMWTPQGYYMGSPGADKIVGWQINKGQEHAADYVGADQLRTHLNRPDIVEKAVILASAERAIREAGATFKLADLLKSPVPRFRILSPAGASTIKGGRVIVKVDIERVPDPIKVIRIHVNGRQVQEITPETGSGGLKGAQDFNVPLGKGRNEVRVTMTNIVGDKTESITLMHDGEGDLDKRGTLYILAIGVQRYPGLGKTCGPNGDASCDLRFAVADALKLVEAAERRLGPAHDKVVKKVLVNGRSDSESPTVDNILDAIDILKEATETDTVLLFIAGHGVNEGPNYRFLATNAERSGASYRGKTVVSWQQLQDAIEAAKGRRILFLDTCHSGSTFNRRIDNAAYHANIITYTAARFDQEALEDSILGHGLFTYAVVEGLEGKGQFGTTREITTTALHEYIKQRVGELAKAVKGEQEPQYFTGQDTKDYVLAKW